MARKKGGGLLGNLLAKGLSEVTGGVIGGKRAALIKAGRFDLINPDAKEASKGYLEPDAETKKVFNTTFAGKPANKNGDTYEMELDEVSIGGADPYKRVNPLLKAAGDAASYLGKRSTEGVEVGADNRTLYVVGACAAALVIALVATKN